VENEPGAKTGSVLKKIPGVPGFDHIISIRSGSDRAHQNLKFTGLAQSSQAGPVVDWNCRFEFLEA
jgi:hypothetical protein